MLKLQINKEVKNKTFPRGFEILRQGSDGRVLLGRKIVGGFEIISIIEEEFEDFDYSTPEWKEPNTFELTPEEIKALSDKYLKNKK
jgi:hypothetical protein